MQEPISEVGLRSLRKNSRLRAMEKRVEPRFRTRLRTGMVLDLDDMFITSCLIRDRSANGARLKLPVDIFVPGEFLFYDEELQTMMRVERRWYRNEEVGVRVLAVLPKDRRQ
jgi:hypothetical protein